MNVQNEYLVQYWVNTPDGYDDNYVKVFAISEGMALNLARVKRPRGKEFKVI